MVRGYRIFLRTIWDISCEYLYSLKPESWVCVRLAVAIALEVTRNLKTGPATVQAGILAPRMVVEIVTRASTVSAIVSDSLTIFGVVIMSCTEISPSRKLNLIELY